MNLRKKRFNDNKTKTKSRIKIRDKLNNKIIALTGTINDYTRAEFSIKLTQHLNVTIKNTITKNVDYLLIGDYKTGGYKFKKAKEYNIGIIKIRDLLEEFENDEILF